MEKVLCALSLHTSATNHMGPYPQAQKTLWWEELTPLVSHKDQLGWGSVCSVESDLHVGSYKVS